MAGLPGGWSVIAGGNASPLFLSEQCQAPTVCLAAELDMHLKAFPQKDPAPATGCRWRAPQGEHSCRGRQTGTGRASAGQPTGRWAWAPRRAYSCLLPGFPPLPWLLPASLGLPPSLSPKCFVSASNLSACLSPISTVSLSVSDIFAISVSSSPLSSFPFF